MTDEILLRVEDLKMHFPILAGVFRRQVGAVKAVDGVSFEILKGETLGLVGESGCGKSTTGRAILQLYEPTAGKVFFDDVDLISLSGEQMRRRRSDIQMIFQDAYSSLNPRMSIGDIIKEPMQIFKTHSGKDADERVDYLLEVVGLDKRYRDRYPHEFSGGQRQRIGIARALMQDPEMILADEPVASLDPVLAHSILEYLEKLNKEDNMTIICSLHYLDLVQRYSTRVIGLKDGNVVYQGSREDIRAMTDREFKDIYGEEAVRVGGLEGDLGAEV